MIWWTFCLNNQVFLGCYPSNPTDISESCDATGVPPTHAPTHAPPSNGWQPIAFCPAGTNYQHNGVTNVDFTWACGSNFAYHTCINMIEDATDSIALQTAVQECSVSGMYLTM